MNDLGIEAFARYLREHPAVLARIQTGEISAEAAAEAAGFDLSNSEANPLDGSELEDGMLESVSGGTNADADAPSTISWVSLRGRRMCDG
jgi:hypothetical protein